MEQSQTPQTIEQAPAKKRPYWFGYLYAAFWTFVTYSCVTHTIVAIRVLFVAMGSQATLADQTKMELIMGAFLWPVATVFFAWVSYRLFTRRVCMKMIYALVLIHAANVLFSGLIPVVVAFWAILSGIEIAKFKELCGAAKV